MQNAVQKGMAVELQWWDQPGACGNPELHTAHYWSPDFAGAPNSVMCQGITERHCTVELPHKPHLFDLKRMRYQCAGVEGDPVEPEPALLRMCLEGHPHDARGFGYDGETGKCADAPWGCGGWAEDDWEEHQRQLISVASEVGAEHPETHGAYHASVNDEELQHG